MNKEKKHRSSSAKSIIIWNTAILLAISAIILATVYWDYYSVWSFIDLSMFGKTTIQAAEASDEPSAQPTYTNTPVPTDTPEPTPGPPTVTKVPTPTPTPTPVPHPGDRDGKFTHGDVIKGDMFYHSQDLSIEITKYYENDITYFVAEVYVRTMDNFFAAFADGKYGSRKQNTSEMAEDNNAIFAVSGDYYNAREGGLIIRNSELYRNLKEPYREVLAIYDDGSMKGFRYSDAYTGELAADESVVHTYVFGPILITDGEAGKEYSERDKSIRHPRLAIGMVEPYHYYFLLADGRKQGYSIGMSLFELYEKLTELGCTEAYNLDGGGTATMVFMNELVNMPQGTTKERGVGDSICFIEPEAYMEKNENNPS